MCNLNKQTNKQTTQLRKEIIFVDTRGGGIGGEGVARRWSTYKLPVTSPVSTRNVGSCTMVRVHTAAWHTYGKAATTADPKSSHHKEKMVFLFLVSL